MLQICRVHCDASMQILCQSEPNKDRYTLYSGTPYLLMVTISEGKIRDGTTDRARNSIARLVWTVIVYLSRSCVQSSPRAPRPAPRAPRPAPRAPRPAFSFAYNPVHTVNNLLLACLGCTGTTTSKACRLSFRVVSWRTVDNDAACSSRKVTALSSSCK
jgi:hypothetical protein